MAAKSVGSLVVLALSACSGTFDGSDKIEVALLRSRRDDNAAGGKKKSICVFRLWKCLVNVKHSLGWEHKCIERYL